LATLEEVRQFEDLLELEDGPPRPHQELTLTEVQSLGLWRYNGQGARNLIERRGAERRHRAREAAEARRKEAERRRWVEAELEHRRQLEEERREAWAAIFALGIPLKP
jgi:septal ring factor EnvC (AmiA/AmiB activator)